MTAEPRTIHACVASARRRLYAARGLESLLIGIFGAELTLAAVSLTGAAISGTPAICVSLLGGAFCGGTYWIEHRRSRAQVASALDAALARSGSLLTAFECETAGTRVGLPGRLVRRERERLSARELRTILPRPVTFAFAPFLGAFVLAAAHELERPSPAATIAEAEPWAALGESEWMELERALDEIEVAALEMLGSPRPTPVDPPTSDPLEESLAQLERALLEAEARGAAGSRLDALRERSEALRNRAVRREGAGDLSAVGDASASGSGSGETRVSSGARLDSGAPPTGPASEKGADAGTAVGRWWSAHQDPVVEGWVEARRAALGDSVR